MTARTDLTVSEIFGDFPALSTEHTRLRKIRVEDAEDLFAYGADPEVSRFVGWDRHESIAVAETYIAGMLERYEAGGLADWGIEHRGDGRFIGTVGFLWWETHEAAAEIGYVMARPYWGRGLMTEVVREVMRFGWDVMGLNRIQAHSEEENVGSRRVLEKCGLSYEGRLRERVHSSDGFVDLLLYAALWRDQRR